MTAKMSVLGPTLSYPQYLRSAQGRFPLLIASLHLGTLKGFRRKQILLTPKRSRYFKIYDFSQTLKMLLKLGILGQIKVLLGVK